MDVVQDAGLSLILLSFISGTFAATDLGQCGEPPPVSNTYRTMSNTTVVYRCIDNYILTSGNLTRTCVNAELTGSPPICELNCGPPLNSGYAGISVTGTGAGSIVTYTCIGESLVNSTTTVCDINSGYWKEGDLCFAPLNMSSFSVVQSSTATSDIITNKTLSGIPSSPSPADITLYGAVNAIDSNVDTNVLSGACSSTGLEQRPHVNITLDDVYTIYQIAITLPDDSFATPLPNLQIRASSHRTWWRDCYKFTDELPLGQQVSATCQQSRYPTHGRYIQLVADFGTETGMLQICNVEIYARPASSVDCGPPFERPYAIILNLPESTRYTHAADKVYYSCIDGYTVKNGREYGYCNHQGSWTASLVCTAGENLSHGKVVWQTTNTSQILPSLTDFNSSSCITVVDVTEATFVIDLEEDTEISDVSVTFFDVQKLGSPTINITVWDSNQAPSSCEPYKLVYYRGETGNAVCKYRPVGRYISVHIFYDETALLEVCEFMVHGRHFDDALECYIHGQKSDYKGKMNMTVTGIPCQRWDSQTPHAHNDTDVSKFPDVSLSDAANYCRNPDGKYGLWCYTTDPDIAWQFCPVRYCDHMCLRDDMGSTYRGYMQKTSSGEDCVPWESEGVPFKKKSHFSQWPGKWPRCRNPLLSQSQPWCYTAVDASDYGLCSIPDCPKSPDLIWGHWVMDTDQTLSDLIPSQECLVWNRFFSDDGNYSATADKAFHPGLYREKFTVSQVCSTGRVFNATVLCSNMSESGTAWRAGILECVHCGQPPAVNQTSSTTSSSYLHGVTKYTCLPGYAHSSGSDVILCTRSGQWEIPDMVCLIDCGPPPSVDHATSSYNSTLEGETAVYTCMEGYSYFSGSDQSTCLASGIWMEPNFTCKVNCGNPPLINNSLASNTSGFVNTSVMFTCSPGYSHVTGSSIITCLETGFWEQPDMYCEVDCGAPPSVNNTHVTTVNTILNSTAIYTCDPGYVHVTGNTSVTCTETGAWEEPTIQCHVDCGAPPDIANTNITMNSSMENSIVDYSCYEGHIHVSGSTRSTCQQNGNWSTISISCLVDCGHPPTAANTTHTASGTWSGSVAQYSCDEGFVLVSGSASIACLQNGTWAIPSIVCERTSTPSTSLQTTTPVPVFNVTDRYGRYRFITCICRCVIKSRHQEEVVSEISRKLLLNTMELISYNMQKKSLPDGRTTSHGMAYLAVSLIAMVFGAIFISDIYYCCSGVVRYSKPSRKYQ